LLFLDTESVTKPHTVDKYTKYIGVYLPPAKLRTITLDTRSMKAKKKTMSPEAFLLFRRAEIDEMKKLYSLQQYPEPHKVKAIAIF
jgi:hypothetical protein